MSNFTIKTHNDRNLVIEAEYYKMEGAHPDHLYIFYDKTGSPVATVPSSPNILAILKGDSDLADFYYSDHEIDDSFSTPVDSADDEDACCPHLDCLLNSEEFFNAVYNIVADYYEPDSDDPTPATAPPAPTSLPVPKVETRKHDGQTLYGFVVPEDRFVHFSSPEVARMGSFQYASGTRGWSTFPLSETELVEEGA